MHLRSIFSFGIEFWPLWVPSLILSDYDIPMEPWNSIWKGVRIWLVIMGRNSENYGNTKVSDVNQIDEET